MFKWKWRKFMWGLMLINTGIFVLAYNYGLISFSFKFSRDWPILIIAFGVLGVLKSVSITQRNKKAVSMDRKQSVEKILRDIEKGAKTANDAIVELSGQN